LVVAVGFMALSLILSGGKVQREKPPDSNKKISEKCFSILFAFVLGSCQMDKLFLLEYIVHPIIL
jgi:hypothetical protein